MRKTTTPTRTYTRGQQLPTGGRYVGTVRGVVWAAYDPQQYATLCRLYDEQHATAEDRCIPTSPATQAAYRALADRMQD